MIPTSFSQLLGNQDIKRYLEKMLEKKAISNSLLFTGPDGVGKSQFAHVLAAQLLNEGDETGEQLEKVRKGEHPDIHHYHPEGKLGLHSINSLRQLGEEVHMPPYEGKWKIFIIYEADRMLSYSANALLKTFEEPPPQTVIILLSRSQASILPTIISRCRVMQFQSISQQNIEDFLSFRYQMEGATLKMTAALAHGSIGRAVYLAEQKNGTQRQELLNLLARGRFETYKELTSAALALAEQVEVTKKHAEEAAKEELYKAPKENMSAVQQQSLEKELEGISTLAFVNEAQVLFDQILSWYRDLQLLQVNGDPAYLINPDYLPALEQALQRGELRPLHQIQQIINDSMLSLQRSTALNITLENLFLKLGLI